MLDSFLETAVTKTKKAEAQQHLDSLLARLPRAVLAKIASGAISLEKTAECSNTWLEQFRGSPFLDQAIAIEKDDLAVQAEEAHRREMETELRASLPSWDETDLKRQQISIRRKLLELELAGASVDGMQSGPSDDDLLEEEAAVNPEMGEPKAAPPVPQEAAAAQEELPMEEEGEEVGPPESSPMPPPKKEESEEKPKPKTEKTTTVTKEKPVDDKEKIDIKAAAARMKVAAARLPLGDEAKTASFTSAADDLVGATGALAYPALAATTGTIGYQRGKAMANREEDINLPLNVAAGLLAPLPGTMPYVIGKALGHSTQTNRLAEKAKTASQVAKAPGMLGRGVQLLTGSRARALEAQAGDRMNVMRRHVATGDRVFKDATFGVKDPVSGEVVREYTDGVAQKALRSNEHRIRNSEAGAARARRASIAERDAVKDARRTAVQAVGVGAAGAGLGAISQSKTAAPLNAANDFVANVMKTAPARRGARAAAPAGVAQAASHVRPSTPPMGMASTVPAKTRGGLSIPPPPSAAEPVSHNPLLSTRTKVLGGAAALGLGTGAAIHHSRKEASAELVKAAFGAAMLSGLKGAAGFARTAGKSIAGAARTGGIEPAMQAAGNAGRAGMMRATNFVSQNPAAGAALVAAPALATGYAAGRQ